MTKTDTSYSLSRAQVRDLVRLHRKTAEMLIRIGVVVPEPTAREELAPQLADGTGGQARGPYRANPHDLRLKGRKVLTKNWQGKHVRVHVARDHRGEITGFWYEGSAWPSLSAIATAICGHRRNGFEFFGLEEKVEVSERSRGGAA